MIKDAITIKTKLKDIIAQQAYNKKWEELSTIQQNSLRSKHRRQFDIFSRRAREEMTNEFTKDEATPTRFCESDRELLIRVDERSGRVEKWCYNHDAHHAKYMYLALSTAIGAIVTLAITLIKVL